MAEKICEENPLVDIDKAYVIANQIFDDAAAGNLYAKRKLKSYVNSFYAFNRGKTTWEGFMPSLFTRAKILPYSET